eukprot:410797-Rhodomonas_salina.2
METKISMAQRERTDRQYMRDGMSLPDKTARTEHITALPDGPQIEHRAGQHVAEEFIRSQVGGDQGVGGEARDGGVELGGESVYFDEPIKAQLASIAPDLCSRFSCCYTYANRTDEPDEIDLTKELTSMVEGTVTGEYTYTNGKVNNSNALALAMIALSEEPKTIAEALEREDTEKWWQAICDEINSWQELGVFKLVDENELRKQQVEIIDGKIVLKLKVDEYSNPVRHKARVVARGFQ